MTILELAELTEFTVEYVATVANRLLERDIATTDDLEDAIAQRLWAILTHIKTHPCNIEQAITAIEGQPQPEANPFNPTGIKQQLQTFPQHAAAPIVQQLLTNRSQVAQQFGENLAETLLNPQSFQAEMLDHFLLAAQAKLNGLNSEAEVENFFADSVLNLAPLLPSSNCYRLRLHGSDNSLPNTTKPRNGSAA